MTLPLMDAALALSREPDTDRLLQRVVRSAADLTGARYAALATYGPGGGIERFVHVGLDEDAAGEIGRPPRGEGLLHELSVVEGPLRLDDVTADGRFGGFPPDHPSMTSFLGVPVLVGGRRFGNLYAADGRAGVFGPGDEMTLTTLAAFAAAAIDNAGRLSAERARTAALAEAAVAEERERLGGEALARAIDAQEAERARVARDLHDQIGQALTSVLLGLHLVDAALGDVPVDPARAAGHTAEVRELVVDALDDVRRLAFDLRPTVLDDLGLEAALRRLASDLSSRQRITVDLALAGLANEVRLPSSVETVAYRVVQEALTNVVRHARASSVTVTSALEDAWLRIEVTDDGVGFDPESAATSLGLRGMHERASLAGGRLSLTSAPRLGCTLLLEVPVV